MMEPSGFGRPLEFMNTKEFGCCGGYPTTPVAPPVSASALFPTGSPYFSSSPLIPLTPVTTTANPLSAQIVSPSSLLGSNTNSKDPLAVKARVFVGNLNTKLVSRDDVEQLFRQFGTVVAISMHTGYGFVQFALEYEARNAVAFTDGTILAGQALDVNLVSEPKVGRESKVSKRQGSIIGPDVVIKRARTVSTRNVSAIQTLVNHNLEKRSATESKGTAGCTTPVNLSRTTCPLAPGATEYSPDIIICGQCRALFDNVEALTAHRKDNPKRCLLGLPLSSSSSPTDPAILSCFICQKNFVHAWHLILHVSKDHHLTILQRNESEKSGDDASTPVLKGRTD